MLRLLAGPIGVLMLAGFLVQAQTVGTSSIRGRILDEQGHIVAGLIVSVQRVDTAPGQSSFAKASWAAPDDAPVFTRDGRTFAFTAADATVMRVDLAAGETKSMDVVVGSRPAFVVTGRLTGIVPGGVVNDALVTVADGDHTLPLIQAFTDFDGRFGIPALPAGHYVVSARRGVCAAAAGVDTDGWPGRFQCDVIFEDAQRWSGTTTIDLDEQGRLTINGAATSEIHIEMAPQFEGPFDGLVRNPLVPHVTRRGTSTLDGVVTDLNHQPLPYTHVAIFSAQLGGARATVTDDQGRFAFHDLPPVAVRLLAAPPGAPALEYGGRGPGTDGTFIALPDRQELHIVWQLRTDH